MEYSGLTISEVAKVLAIGEISPVELLEIQLERIGRLDPQLHAFITLTPDDARAKARESEARFLNGKPRGALDGIPIALKDLFETKGIRTTAGTKCLENFVPGQDCAVVERLREAGAVILGKLNMHECALGVTNDNLIFGRCRNPWALDHIPGGSSGGSAVALAARLCFGALGTDTGGSTRVPAALCGMVGLKPTYGRISLRGVIPVSWTLDHIGPMGRSVRDVALLLEAIAGYDPEDPTSINVVSGSYTETLDGELPKVRIGLANQGLFAEADVEVSKALTEAAKVFGRLGANIEEIEITTPKSSGISSTEAAVFYRQYLREHPDDFGADIRSLLEAGATRPATDYAEARRAQLIIRRQFEGLFESFDLLLTPTTPIAAPTLAGGTPSHLSHELTRFTGVFNIAGVPAISMPGGMTKSGLPIGIQLAGPHWKEASLLRAAFAFEQNSQWAKFKPVL